MPILDDAAAWFVGKTLDGIDLGDLIGYLLEPTAGTVPTDIADLAPGHRA